MGYQITQLYGCQCHSILAHLCLPQLLLHDVRNHVFQDMQTIDNRQCSNMHIHLVNCQHIFGYFQVLDQSQMRRNQPFIVHVFGIFQDQQLVSYLQFGMVFLIYLCGFRRYVVLQCCTEKAGDMRIITPVYWSSTKVLYAGIYKFEIQSQSYAPFFVSLLLCLLIPSTNKLFGCVYNTGSV